MKFGARIGIVLLAATLLSGCAFKNLFATGVSLEGVGNQFVAISEQVTDGCAKRIITVQTCEKYRVFGEHFKRTYPVAVGVWEAARRAGDSETEQKAEDVIRRLSVDLARLAAEALRALYPEEVQ